MDSLCREEGGFAGGIQRRSGTQRSKLVLGQRLRFARLPAHCESLRFSAPGNNQVPNALRCRPSARRHLRPAVGRPLAGDKQWTAGAVGREGLQGDLGTPGGPRFSPPFCRPNFNLHCIYPLFPTKLYVRLVKASSGSLRAPSSGEQSLAAALQRRSARAVRGCSHEPLSILLFCFFAFSLNPMGWFVCEGDAGRGSGPRARGQLPREQPAGAGLGGCPTAQSRTCQFIGVLIAASSSPQLMPLPFSHPAARLYVGLGILLSFVLGCLGSARRKAGGCSGLQGGEV